ncbi:MAG: RlmE family RNA methyltransferase [Treponema sp.]|nr:RlmE family RNA methyltransferase [Treponema sp.]
MPSKYANDYAQSDFWSKKAFTAGYPARSVWKLKEIDEKFSFIQKNCVALDLGAAPGSWTLYLLKNGAARVVSCDLNQLAEIVDGEGLTFIQGDLNETAVREKIKSFSPYDVVVCDAAPSTTGNRTVDTARSEQLVEMALWYAATMLKNGGNFAVKIFQSGRQQELLKKMRAMFTLAKGFKPEACRAESFETYLVGIGKKDCNSQ